MKTVITGCYSPEHDITFIIQEKFYDGEPYSLKVTGFYYGEPEEQYIEKFKNKRYCRFCFTKRPSVFRLLANKLKRLFTRK